MEEAAKAVVATVNQFVETHPGQLDLIEWVLFDEHTYSVYQNMLDRLLVSRIVHSPRLDEINRKLRDGLVWTIGQDHAITLFELRPERPYRSEPEKKEPPDRRRKEKPTKNTGTNQSNQPESQRLALPQGIVSSGLLVWGHGATTTKKSGSPSPENQGWRAVGYYSLAMFKVKALDIMSST